MTLVSRSRYWLPLIPLLLLLACVYWLDSQVQQEIALSANNERHDPDGIMDHFHAIKMDLQGEPRFLLTASQLRHYPDHDTTELEMPRMTMLTQDRPPVHINGQQGNISSLGDEVVFRANVNVQREAVGDQSAMTLQTEYLRVLPNRDWADTDKAVTIINANNTVHAVGLEMDNKARTMKLLSQVRSVHYAK